MKKNTFKMSYKLYLDDIRMPHVSAKKFPYLAELYNDPDWIIVRSYDDFTLLIRNRWDKLKEAPSIISFDHDLGFEGPLSRWRWRPTGADRA